MTERACQDPFFLGYALDAHARQKEWDDRVLAEHLQCPPDRLPHLFLCRCPDGDDPQFTDHVRRIAEYAPCDANQLLLVLREAETLRRLSGHSSTKVNSFFLAARDRQDGKGHDNEENPTDGDNTP